MIATEQRRFPSTEQLTKALGDEVQIVTVAIPRDCADGFAEAYYARPESLLDPEVRAAQSGWMLTDPAAVSRGVQRLSDDLRSGAWDRRYGHFRQRAESVCAVRLLIAKP